MSWPDYLARHYATGTIREYGRDITRYLNWLGGEPAALAADYATIVGYLAYLRRSYDNPATVRRILAAIKTYHRYLLESGRRADHPAASLMLQGGRKKGEAIQLQDLLDAAELQRLLAAPVKLYGRLAGRGVPIVSLLVHQALCVREITGLTVHAIDLQTATVSIPESSRTASRRLPLVGSQVMALHDYLHELRPRLLRESRPTQKLFLTQRGGEEQKQNIDMIVRKLRPAVGGKPVTPLLIRQSVIAERLRRGEGLRQVQVFAGHKWIATTEGYRETGLGELRQALGRYHPLEDNSNNP